LGSSYRGSDAAVLVPPHTRVLAPVALRPVVVQSPWRSLVDRLLLVAEWVAAIALVVFAAYQIANGPVRDWLHEGEQADLAAQTVSAPPQPNVANTQGERAAPPVAPDVQSTAPALVTDTERGLHPELGYALPSIGDKWRRPAVAPDYLQPARDFVPAAAAPPAPVVEPDPPVAPASDPRPLHVSAPAVGIDTVVEEVFLEDGVWQVADYAAGYLHGTGVPGSGNVVMAGHQGTYGAVFATLQSLKPGHDVFVNTATQRYRYRVRETGNVWPSQVSVMYPSATPTLTLITCTNWDMQRFVVIADLVDVAPLAGGAS
jgi:sortase A